MTYDPYEWETQDAQEDHDRRAHGLKPVYRLRDARLLPISHRPAQPRQAAPGPVTPPAPVKPVRKPCETCDGEIFIEYRGNSRYDMTLAEWDFDDRARCSFCQSLEGAVRTARRANGPVTLEQMHAFAQERPERFAEIRTWCKKPPTLRPLATEGK